jgi:FkbM family methyltransferase
MEDPRRRRYYHGLNIGAQHCLGSTIKTGPARGLRFSGGDTAGYILGLSEPVVQRTLVEHLRPGQVYFDVGAHAGFLALLGARVVGPTGKVHCFEPVPANVDTLTRNLTSNKLSNTDVHRIALGEYDGMATMDMDGRNITASLRADGYGEHVRVARLDSLTGLPAPHLIKIDVEGAESSVLRGALELLQRNRPVLVIELHGDEEHSVRSLLSDIYYPEPRVVRDGGMPHLIALP